MLGWLAEKLTDASIEMGAISQDDRELYLYSYRDLMAQLSHWVALLVLGVILGELIGTILFVLFFMPLRMYSGGYHERSYERCFWSSLIVYVAVAYACPILSQYITNAVALSITAIGFIIVFCKSPVEDPNKPLDEKEVKRYRRVSRVVAMSEAILVVGMVVLGIEMRLILFAVAGIATAAILLILKAKK